MFGSYKIRINKSQYLASGFMKKIYCNNVKIINLSGKREGDYYVYKTEFPDAENDGVIPYYYGRGKYKGDLSKDKYIGSPSKARDVFLEQLEQENKATKKIVRTFAKNADCADFEKKTIDRNYGKKGCLNGSIFSPLIPKEELIKNAKKAYAAGLGKMPDGERKRIQREGIKKKIGTECTKSYFKKIGANGGRIGGKKAYENKNGIHNTKDPVVAAGRAKGHQELAKKYAREFNIIDPKGNLVTVKNLAKFCRDNNLNRGNIRSVLNGKIKSSLGWTRPDQMPE